MIPQHRNEQTTNSTKYLLGKFFFYRESFWKNRSSRISYVPQEPFPDSFLDFKKMPRPLLFCFFPWGKAKEKLLRKTNVLPCVQCRASTAPLLARKTSWDFSLHIECQICHLAFPSSFRYTNIYELARVLHWSFLDSYYQDSKYFLTCLLFYQIFYWILFYQMKWFYKWL